MISAYYRAVLAEIFIIDNTDERKNEMKKLKMKRFWGLVLAFALVLTSVPLTGLAETEQSAVTSEEDAENEPVVLSEEEDGIVASGTCGDNLTWELDSEGTLTISGTGSMHSYSGDSSSSNKSPWYQNKQINKVFIGDGIKCVGSSAFYGCTEIQDVDIGDGVEYVGSNAFYGCVKIQDVELGSNIIEIRDKVFSGCSSLTEIELPDSVTYIGREAFLGCSKLKDITLSSNLASISRYTFVDCDSLERIYIPSSVSSIEECAFFNCYNLKYIYFKGEIPEIYSVYDNSEIDYDDLFTMIGDSALLNEGLIGYYSILGTTDFSVVKEPYRNSITWIPWNPETGEIIDDSQNIEDSDETDGFSITSGLGYGRYCIIGNEIKLMGSYTASNGNAEEEANAIEWSSSNSDIAEIMEFSCDSGSEKVSYDLTVKGHKAGIATITGAAEDGRSVSFELSVEPELQSNICSSSNIVINESGDVECSVQLTEPDAEYLENFISKVSMKITDDDNGAASVSKRSYEVAEDGLSAKSVLSIVANYDGNITLKITSEYGQEITGDVRTKSKYGRPGEIGNVEKEDGLAFYDEPYYSKGVKEIVWKNGMYTQSEITVRLKLTYNPTEDTGKSATISKIKFSLDNLDMFKIDGQDEIYPDIQLSPGEEYTCYATLVKRGMFWKKPKEGTTEVGTITAEVEGDFPSMENDKKYSLEVHVTTEKQEEESSDNTEEDQELEQEVDADAEVAITAFENVSDKIALDSRLSAYLGKNQSSALELVLFSEIVLVNMSKDKWTEAGFSDQVVEKVMDNFLGDWKPKVGIQIKDVPVSVIVKSENHGKIQCDFVCHLDGYTLNDSTFAVSGRIDTQLTFIDEENRTVTLAQGIINHCDIKKFTDAAWNISSEYLKQGYNDVLGNQANEWIKSLKNKGIDKIASMAAPYGLKKPVEKLLEKFYDKKLKDKLDTFTILCYPAKQSVAKCPVDVYIYDLNETLAGSIENDEVTLNGDDMALWTVGDDKYIQLFNNSYKVVYKSTGQGSMDLEIYDQSDGITDLRSCKFDDVPLEESLEYESVINDTILADSSSYNLLSNRGEIIVPDSTEYIGPLLDDEEETHCHKYNYSDNGNGTHKGTCEACALSITEEHIYVNGECICGAKEPADSTNLSTCKLLLSESEYTYDGTEKEPTLTITNGDQILTEGIDYTISYSNNVNAGTASVTATGQGNYTGTITETFTIKKADQEIKATISSANLTEGETAAIEASATAGALSYSSSDTAVATVDEDGVVTAVSIGTATITITAEGNENYNPATTAIEITITEKPQQHTHEYGDPVFEWAEDYSCKAVFTCKDKDDEQTLDCTVTSEVTDPTCTKDGETVYTATVEFDGQTYADTKTVPGDPVTGHSYEYTDNRDGTHTATCVKEDDSFTKDHVFKDGVCICGVKGKTSSELESPIESEPPTELKNSDSEESNKPTVDTQNIHTGDNNNMFLWIALLFVSIFGVVGTVLYRKKKKENVE